MCIIIFTPITAWLAPKCNHKSCRHKTNQYCWNKPRWWMDINVYECLCPCVTKMSDINKIDEWATFKLPNNDLDVCAFCFCAREHLKLAKSDKKSQWWLGTFSIETNKVLLLALQNVRKTVLHIAKFTKRLCKLNPYTAVAANQLTTLQIQEVPNFWREPFLHLT